MKLNLYEIKREQGNTLGNEVESDLITIWTNLFNGTTQYRSYWTALFRIFNRKTYPALPGDRKRVFRRFLKATSHLFLSFFLSFFRDNSRPSVLFLLIPSFLISSLSFYLLCSLYRQRDNKIWVWVTIFTFLPYFWVVLGSIRKKYTSLITSKYLCMYIWLEYMIQTFISLKRVCKFTLYKEGPDFLEIGGSWFCLHGPV